VLALSCCAANLQMQECHIRQRVQELYDSEELVSIRASVHREIARKRLVVWDDKDTYAGELLQDPAKTFGCADRSVAGADLNLREEFIGLLPGTEASRPLPPSRRSTWAASRSPCTWTSAPCEWARR
jgi:hypothetical protein